MAKHRYESAWGQNISAILRSMILRITFGTPTWPGNLLNPGQPKFGLGAGVALISSRSSSPAPVLLALSDLRAAHAQRILQKLPDQAKALLGNRIKQRRKAVLKIEVDKLEGRPPSHLVCKALHRPLKLRQGCSDSAPMVSNLRSRLKIRKGQPLCRGMPRHWRCDAKLPLEGTAPIGEI